MTLELLVGFGVLPLLAASLLLVAWRAWRGPTGADRVVALDTLAMIGVGLAAALTVWSDQPALGDAVLVISIVSFLGTIAYARHLERET